MNIPSIICIKKEEELREILGSWIECLSAPILSKRCNNTTCIMILSTSTSFLNFWPLNQETGSVKYDQMKRTIQLREYISKGTKTQFHNHNRPECTLLVLLANSGQKDTSLPTKKTSYWNRSLNCQLSLSFHEAQYGVHNLNRCLGPLKVNREQAWYLFALSPNSPYTEQNSLRKIGRSAATAFLPLKNFWSLCKRKYPMLTMLHSKSQGSILSPLFCPPQPSTSLARRIVAIRFLETVVPCQHAFTQLHESISGAWIQGQGFLYLTFTPDEILLETAVIIHI